MRQAWTICSKNMNPLIFSGAGFQVLVHTLELLEPLPVPRAFQFGNFCKKNFLNFSTVTSVNHCCSCLSISFLNYFSHVVFLLRSILLLQIEDQKSLASVANAPWLHFLFLQAQHFGRIFSGYLETSELVGNGLFNHCYVKS